MLPEVLALTNLWIAIILWNLIAARGLLNSHREYRDDAEILAVVAAAGNGRLFLAEHRLAQARWFRRAFVIAQLAGAGAVARQVFAPLTDADTRIATAFIVYGVLFMLFCFERAKETARVIRQEYDARETRAEAEAEAEAEAVGKRRGAMDQRMDQLEQKQDRDLTISRETREMVSGMQDTQQQEKVDLGEQQEKVRDDLEAEREERRKLEEGGE